MADNGATGRLRFNFDSRKLWLPYAAIRFGQLRNGRNSLIGELMAGQAIPSNSTKTLNYTVEIVVQGPVSSTPYTANFISKSFMMYGPRLFWEHSLDELNSFRFCLGLAYLSGKFKLNEQAIVTPSNNKVIFRDGQLNVASISLGLFYYLKTPNSRKEQICLGMSIYL